MGREPTSTVGVALRTMSREGGTRRVAGGSSNCSAVQLLVDRLRHVGIEHGCALELLRRRVDIGKDVKWRDLPHRSVETTAYTYADVDTHVLREPLPVRRGQVATSGYRDKWDCPGWRKIEQTTKWVRYRQQLSSGAPNGVPVDALRPSPSPAERFSPPSSNGLEEGSMFPLTERGGRK